MAFLNETRPTSPFVLPNGSENQTLLVLLLTLAVYQNSMRFLLLNHLNVLLLHRCSAYLVQLSKSFESWFIQWLGKDINKLILTVNEMQFNTHGRMILASVEKGPLVWPSITEDGVTRLKEYVELTPAEAIQADCDIKAINIILQGLPTEIYALLEYAPTTYQQQQPEFSQPDSSLVVPVFQKGDDPIDAINHMMSFLTLSSPIPGRQTTYAAGTTRKYTPVQPGASGSNTGKQRTVICYNCKGEGHIAKQCTKPKRKRDDTWFNDKVLLVQAQASGQALTEDEIAFLADPGLPDIQTSQTVITHNAAYQADDLDAYDSDL
ncbi:retrovirus-related pol polyprotein from transposon TNT 1-94 [Tanacetum coccineum]